MQQMTLTCCWVPSLQVFPKQTGSCCAVSVTTLSCRQLPWGSCTMYAFHQGFFWLHFLVFQVSLFLPVRHLCYSPKAEVSILKEADFLHFKNIFERALSSHQTLKKSKAFLYCSSSHSDLHAESTVNLVCPSMRNSDWIYLIRAVKV